MSDRDMQELFRMQEEAKKRVEDMRSRSRFAADRMNRAFGSPPAPPPAPQTQRPGPPEPAPPEPPGRPEKNGPDREELERLFILSLCLLLSHEEADESVLLGLLYLLT